MRFVNDLRIFFVFLLVAVFFGMINHADAFIEIKKAYVINSDKVCGDKLCDEVKDESHQPRKNKDTPLGQYKLGIPLDQIVCREGLELIIKSSNWHPACVKSENVKKLVSKGWAMNSNELDNVFSAIKQKPVYQFKPLTEYQKEFPKTAGVGIDIQPDVIDGNLYLILDGYGWHGFHNVEITISNDEGLSEFVMSQTRDNGDLYLPWQVPKTFVAGMYDVYATDGINEFEIRIPIAAP